MTNNKKNNHYETLGVTRDAPVEVIKVAYQALARAYHPDRNPGDLEAPAKMAAINAAHDILADRAKRAQYDAGLLLDEAERNSNTKTEPSFNRESGHLGNYESPPFLERFALASVLIVTAIVFIATMASVPPTGPTNLSKDGATATQEDEMELVETIEASTRCWKHKNGEVTCEARGPLGEDISESVVGASWIDGSSEKLAFWRRHALETAFGAATISIALFAWWLLTRRPSLRNNVLIGLCVLGAFVVNSIAGSILAAAWMISQRLPLMSNKHNK
jgi:hypothetical protein